MSYSPPSGSAVQVVSYTGNGASSNKIPVKGTPHVVILKQDPYQDDHAPQLATFLFNGDGSTFGLLGASNLYGVLNITSDEFVAKPPAGTFAGSGYFDVGQIDANIGSPNFLTNKSGVTYIAIVL